MSKYPHYEVKAVSGQPSREEPAEVRKRSSQATITARKRHGVHDFGNFKGNPLALVTRFDDKNLSRADWGARTFMLRHEGTDRDHEDQNENWMGSLTLPAPTSTSWLTRARLSSALRATLALTWAAAGSGCAMSVGDPPQRSSAHAPAPLMASNDAPGTAGVSQATAGPDAQPGAPIDVLDYAVEATLDPRGRALLGSVTLRLGADPARRSITLDADQIEIIKVQDDRQRPLAFAHDGSKLRILWSDDASLDPVRSVSIRYAAREGQGLRFESDRIQALFHTRAWMPCNDAPSDRATWTLSLRAPYTHDVIATGLPVAAPTAAKDGLVEHKWRAEAPVAPYLLGFIAAPLTRRSQLNQGLALEVAATSGFEGLIDPVMGRTWEMARFFEARAGAPLPGGRTTMIIVAGKAAQEMGTFSVLGADWIVEMAADPQEDWLVAHELAHQWWGNSVTMQDWSHFWLHEGVVSFMVAAFKEQRWGRAAYEREVVLSRRRLWRLIEEGAHRALVDPSMVEASQARRPLDYAKGLLALHALRALIGDAAFWQGLQDFTRQNMGRSTTTGALQAAMERASAQDLSGFFALWVTSAALPTIKARHRLEGDQVLIELEVHGAGPGGPLPLDLAVETDEGRQRRRVEVKGAGAGDNVWAFSAHGEVRSVRVDDGGALPTRVDHPRPVEMLAWQSLHEPDDVGRAEALETLEGQCEAEVAGACAALDRVVRGLDGDPSRLMRELGARARRSPPPDDP